MPLNVEAARQQMVTQQVRAWEVLDPTVLRVLSEVPRERFVPAQYRTLAFADTAIPLAGGQRMMTPQVEGRVLQALLAGPGSRILEIGSGSGFLSACLARLGEHVTSLELRAELGDSARQSLRELRIDNVEVVIADAFRWRPTAQFNCIAIGGSLPVYDTRFQEWLAPGGRLFVVTGQPPAMEAALITRTDLGTQSGSYTRESLFETVLDPLDNAPQPERFVF